MKRFVQFTFALIWILLMFPMSDALIAQSDVQLGGTRFWKRNLGGPRLGITFVPGNGELVQKLKENEMSRMLSQFGWHFEKQVNPQGGGPSFVIQFVPLLGGVEYGKVIPSFTLAMGIRLPNGYEFGMGPNVLFGGANVSSSLVIAVGKSFNYGGVNLPFNLAFAKNPSGSRISFIFGYAIGK